jgi:hypothetical protein
MECFARSGKKLERDGCGGHRRGAQGGCNRDNPTQLEAARVIRASSRHGNDTPVRCHAQLRRQSDPRTLLRVPQVRAAPSFASQQREGRECVPRGGGVTTNPNPTIVAAPSPSPSCRWQLQVGLPALCAEDVRDELMQCHVLRLTHPGGSVVMGPTACDLEGHPVIYKVSLSSSFTPEPNTRAVALLHQPPSCTRLRASYLNARVVCRAWPTASTAGASATWTERTPSSSTASSGRWTPQAPRPRSPCCSISR